MEKENIDFVVEAVGRDASIRIPEARLHGVVVAHFLTEIDHIAPRDLAVLRARDVVNRHGGRAGEKQSTREVKYRFE